MIEIQWEAYLGDELRNAIAEDLKETEKRIKRSLPDALKNMIQKHGGETPLNLLTRQLNTKIIQHKQSLDV